MSSLRKAVRLLGGTIGVLLLCLPLFSQANFGRILGTITDLSGGVMAGATVSVVDTQRGVTRTLTTDPAGEYLATNLSPGMYMVRAEAKGFKTVERQNIVLEVGKDIRVDLSLQPGAQTQTVTVTEQVPDVDTTSATLGGTLNNAAIIDLPLNGRNYQNLVGLRPGVMIQPGGSPWSQATNNIRPDETAWMVDGIINSNFYDGRPLLNFPSPFSDAATILPVDAIQEFNVEENPKAEWGWKPGAIVNVGIKSGTNTFHGSAYAFGRTDSWDARNFFNPAPASGTCLLNTNIPAVCNKTIAELKQYGGVVGGPIKKDKLFFFTGYERLRSLIGNSSPSAAPFTGPGSIGADPTHSMVDAINGVIAARGAAAVSPVSLKLLGCTTAPVACTGGLFTNAPANAPRFLSTFPNVNRSDNGIAKLDYHLNSKHTLNYMFFLGNYTSVGEDHPFINAAFEDTSPIRSLVNVANWIWTPNSTVVNELRVGYNRSSFNFVNVDVNVPADGKGYPINTGVTNPKAGGLPNIFIDPFGNPGGGWALGTANNRPQYYSPNPYLEVTDGVGYLKGKHALKFGGSVAHIEADSGVFVQGRGQFSFHGGNAFAGSTPLEDYFAGAPSSGLLQTGNALIQTTWMHYAAYVQDDWRFSPKLTVNVGLRYEYHSPIKEKNGLFGSFDPNLGMVQQSQLGGSIYKPYRKDFSPRLGFAWDVSGKGTTVVRGGFSIIYSSFLLENFVGQFVLQNSSATGVSAVPTAAQLFTNGTGIATGQGTGAIKLSNASFLPSQLCWDPATCALVGGKAGQATVFPIGLVRCGSGRAPDPGPCNLMGVDPNLKDPYITNWNIGIQHAFNSNLSVDVSYVGNHGTKLINFRDINQPALGAAWCLNSLTAAQIADACAAGPGSLSVPPATNPGGSAQAAQEGRPFFAKFPYLGIINWMSNNVHSNFSSLQASLTERPTHGLSFIAGYTYGHGLDNYSLNRFGLLPQDANNSGRAEYASSDFDIRHRFTLTTTYDIPGKQGFGQLLEGWQINSIVNYQTPQVWQTFDNGNNFSGTLENADRWDIFGSPSGFGSSQLPIPYCANIGTPGVNCTQTSPLGIPIAPLPTSLAAKCTAVAPDPVTLAVGGCYVTNSGVLVPPKLGTFGNMGRNIFRDSGFKNWDLSVFKNFTFKERYGAQFRVEVFNILNHPNIGNPYGASNFGGIGDALNGPGTFGCGCLTPDNVAGNPLIGSGSARVMQLGLKLKF
jgi:Carboxypeptidase regulatory-like domain/TonB dependent receptor